MNKPLRIIMKTIAQRFNESNIVWGLGGSALLDVYGLNVKVNDLDILVESKDFDKAIEILDQIGDEKHKPSNPNFRTAHFKTYQIENCAVDVMSGISVKHHEVWFDFIFIAHHIVSKTNIDAHEIPLMGLEDWYRIYQALDRKDKIELIDRYRNEKGKEIHDPLES